MQTAQRMRADLTCTLCCRKLDTFGCTVMVNYLIGGGMGYVLGQDAYALSSPLAFHSLPVIHPSLMQGNQISTSDSLDQDSISLLRAPCWPCACSTALTSRDWSLLASAACDQTSSAHSIDCQLPGCRVNIKCM